MRRALLLTVGTGNIDNLEASLFVPLRISIERGEWERIVLLPSLITFDNAEVLRGHLAGLPIAIEPLPKPGVEDDADRCFEHFDRVIERLRADGFAAEEIVVDFTRGTKAMSAALVLAAVRHEIPRLRYIASVSRDVRGLVVPGTEELRETSTARATARRIIDLACGLMERGAFGAALVLLPDPENPFSRLGWTAEELDPVSRMRGLVEFYAAWDRLDHAAAARIRFAGAKALPAAWRRFYPPERVRDWVRRLSAAPKRSATAETASRQRLLAIDLLANAERRVRQHQLEDALVRCYRIAELCVQARLAERGFDLDEILVKDGRVRAVLPCLQQTGIAPRKPPPGWRIRGRDGLIGFLRCLGDPDAERLADFDRAQPMLRAHQRNDSILIHGDLPRGRASEVQWRALLSSLERLLMLETGGDAADHLAVARFPNGWSI